MIAVVAVCVIATVGSALTGGKSSDAEKPITATESTVKDEELDNDMVKVTDVKLERVTTEEYPQALLNNLYLSSSTSLYKMTGTAENRSDSVVVSSPVLTGTVKYTDKYGDAKEAETLLESGNPSFDDMGSFVLAPGEKRDVTVFFNWQDTTLARDGSEDQELVIDTKTVKVQSLKTKSGKELSGNYLPVTSDNIKLIGDSGITSAPMPYSTGNAQVGPSFNLTNTTKMNLRTMTVVYTYSYDGVEAPSRFKKTVEYVKAGKQVEVTSGKNKEGELDGSDAFSFDFSGSDDGSDGRLKLVPLAISYETD